MKVKTLIHSGLVVMVLLALASCTDTAAVEVAPMDEAEPRYVDLSRHIANQNGRSSSGNYEVLMAEYITSGDNADEMGNIVFFRDVGNKQLAGDFVPLPGFTLDGTTEVSYYIDQNRPTADVPVGISTAAIDRAMATWDGLTWACSRFLTMAGPLVLFPRFWDSEVAPTT